MRLEPGQKLAFTTSNGSEYELEITSRRPDDRLGELDQLHPIVEGMLSGRSDSLGEFMPQQPVRLDGPLDARGEVGPRFIGEDLGSIALRPITEIRTIE